VEVGGGTQVRLGLATAQQTAARCEAVAAAALQSEEARAAVVCEPLRQALAAAETAAADAKTEHV
jgi:hypothetical protein